MLLLGRSFHLVAMAPEAVEVANMLSSVYTRAKLMIGARIMTPTASQGSGIAFRIFMGFELNSEMKMHLQQSEDWKNRHIASEEKRYLEEASIQGRSYLGIFLANEMPSLEEIREMESCFRDEFLLYCPALKFEQQNLVLFPQIFLK